MLASNALTTPERLASFMGIDTPTGPSLVAMEVIINSVSSFIERYTGRTFKKTTFTNEEYAGERGQSINLKHFPLISSEPFIISRRNSQLNEDGWEDVDALYYAVDYNSGIINSMGGSFFGRNQNGYRITYTAGYDFDNVTTFLGDTEAADVELATWLIAQDIWKNKSVDPNIKSERIGDYSVTYAESMGTMFQNAQAQGILDTYADLLGEGVLTPLQSI